MPGEVRMATRIHPVPARRFHQRGPRRRATSCRRSASTQRRAATPPRRRSAAGSMNTGERGSRDRVHEERAGRPGRAAGRCRGFLRRCRAAAVGTWSGSTAAAPPARHCTQAALGTIRSAPSRSSPRRGDHQEREASGEHAADQPRPPHAERRCGAIAQAAEQRLPSIAKARPSPARAIVLAASAARAARTFSAMVTSTGVSSASHVPAYASANRLIKPHPTRSRLRRARVDAHHPHAVLVHVSAAPEFAR